MAQTKTKPKSSSKSKPKSSSKSSSKSGSKSNSKSASKSNSKSASKSNSKSASRSKPQSRAKSTAKSTRGSNAKANGSGSGSEAGGALEKLKGPATATGAALLAVAGGVAATRSRKGKSGLVKGLSGKKVMKAVKKVDLPDPDDAIDWIEEKAKK